MSKVGRIKKLYRRIYYFIKEININYETCDEACLKEIYENRDTLQKAYEWAEKGAILTFTWHWYSPVGGRDKAFYTKNTDFDARKVLEEGTEERNSEMGNV